LHLPSDRATLHIEGHLLIVLTKKSSSILHDNNVDIQVIVALDGKNPINSCKQGLIVSGGNVVDVVIQHVKQDLLLRGFEGFDKKLVVEGEKEE
jgi:hypothetical protein